MLVRVVRLREQGRKLARIELEAPIAGCLQLSRSWVDRGDPEGRQLVSFAHIRAAYGDNFRDLLPPLAHAQVTKIGPRGMLLLGAELTPGVVPPHPRQAWWCEPATGGPSQPPARGDDLAAMELESFPKRAMASEVS